jgi:hypothetical protein
MMKNAKSEKTECMPRKGNAGQCKKLRKQLPLARKDDGAMPATDGDDYLVVAIRSIKDWKR